MDVITQTNRTILFEEINPEKNDLLKTMGMWRAWEPSAS